MLNIVEQLKNQGFRLTKPRMEIINVLEEYPRTIQELFEILNKRKVSIDLSSLYRTLELLVGMGFVHEVELGEGRKRYELLKNDAHHHHVVCKKCGNIEDVMIDENIMMQEINKQSKFKIESHTLEFFGQCAKCK